jgi:hypothetical protein
MDYIHKENERQDVYIQGGNKMEEPKKEPEKEEKEKLKNVDMDEEEEETEEDKKCKKKKKKKAIDDEEEEDEDKLEKEEANPEQDTASATDANSTVTTGSVIAGKPDIFVPQTRVAGSRDASTGGNMVESFSGKSIQPDLMKSPLFVEISKQLTDMKASTEKKLAAIEKSVTDRVANIQKSVEVLDKLSKQPIYKAVSESNAPEAIVREGIKEQIEKGKLRFAQ